MNHHDIAASGFLSHATASLSSLAIKCAVRRALDEDLGRVGDITSMATIPEAATVHAVLIARQSGIIAGLSVAAATFRALEPGIGIDATIRDGDMVKAGTHLLMLWGSARAVLGGERTALNFVSRMAGIATLTAHYVKQAAGSKLRICCTRKTAPGLRALDYYAVRCGDGFNHRFGLDDAVLIQDNHIAVAGGIAPVLRQARADLGHLTKIEIEVATLKQLRDVLDTGLADAVLLDHMDPGMLAEAVRLADGRVVLEASGVPHRTTIADIAATGIDYASIGALTHSAPSFDIALDLEPC